MQRIGEKNEIIDVSTYYVAPYKNEYLFVFSFEDEDLFKMMGPSLISAKLHFQINLQNIEIMQYCGSADKLKTPDCAH